MLNIFKWYDYSLQQCMVKCNGLQECLACAQIKGECFICNMNATTGMIIPDAIKPRFLFWAEDRIIQGLNTF